MLNFRNGYKAWKVQIWEDYGAMRDISGNVIEVIFPSCNRAGTIENYTTVAMTKQTIGRKKINKLFGWDQDFIFNYDEFALPAVIDGLKLIVDYWQEKHLYTNLQLMLFPRLDNLARFVSVYPSEQTISIAINGGGQNAYGNKGVIIRFNSIDIVSKLPTTDPNNLAFGLSNLTVK